MATVYVSMGQVGSPGSNGIVEAFRSGTVRSEAITSSGTSAAGALVARKNDFAQIYCASAVYVKAGPATPTAAAATALFVEAGRSQYMALQAGDIIAVIDV